MKLRFIYILLLSSFLFNCKSEYVLQKTEKSKYVLSDSSNSGIDSSIYRFIAPYKAKMDGAMSEVIASSEYAMEKGVPESKLGNFVADACMIEAKKVFYPGDNRQADFAFFNNGGLRRSLPKGNITRGDVFELMPFENELVVLKLNGVVVKKIFNFIASMNGAPVSGVKFRISEKQATDIYINDIPFDSTGTYKVLTSDYLANGGDSYDFITDAPRENVNLKVRDAILNYLTGETKAGRTISVNTDGRISNAR